VSWRAPRSPRLCYFYLNLRICSESYFVCLRIDTGPVGWRAPRSPRLCYSTRNPVLFVTALLLFTPYTSLVITGRFYRRNLPHLERDSDALFVTFCTKKRIQLPEHLRQIVLQTCIYEHNRRIQLHAVVVMPDHVHMVLEKKFDSADQRTPALGEIMHSIKGASSHAINKLLDRRGPLWQEEWFDRLPRSADSFHAKIAYVLDNPVRKGLAATRYEYPYLWLSNPELLTQVPLRHR
jgi:putative transposase